MQFLDIGDKILGTQLFDMFLRREDLSAYSAECCFGREHLSAVFRLIRSLSPYSGGTDWLAHLLEKEIGTFRVMIAVNILRELGLLSVERENKVTTYTVIPSNAKSKISDADTFKKLKAMQLTAE